jgi:ligand-binding SRPBCC domain-containing protein
MSWRVVVSCRLEAPAEEVWTLLQRPRTLEHIAAPLVRFRAIEPQSWPEVWTEGRYLCAMRLFGLIPLGRQWIVITHSDAEPGDPPGTRRLRDNGTGGLVRTWDHMITLSPDADGTSAYRDEVSVGAGLLTPFIWLFAAVFYRWRQWRWRGLLRAERRNRPAPAP